MRKDLLIVVATTGETGHVSTAETSGLPALVCTRQRDCPDLSSGPINMSQTHVFVVIKLGLPHPFSSCFCATLSTK